MPVWTPDGKELIFAGFTLDRDTRLFRHSASAEAPLGRLPERAGTAVRFRGGLLGDPTFRPRTEGLACASWESRGSHVMRVGLDAAPNGEAVTARFSARLGSGAQPALSPDGRRVAFVSEFGRSVVWLTRLDGTGARKLTSDEAELGGQPAWSPHARWVAHVEVVEGNADIYVTAVDGWELSRRLTRHAAEDTQPAWSPDGRWIYFVSSRGGASRFWRVPATGGLPEAVGPSRGAGLAWPRPSPDGRYLYFARGCLGNAQVWRMSIGGGGEERILEAVSLHSTWQVTREALYYIGPSQADGKAPLRRLDLATSRDRQLALLEGPVNHGLSVSPDGRVAFHAQTGRPSADLLMLEDR